MELILFSPAGDGGRRYTLANGETMIGRRPDCRIVLDAPSIAPRHARLFHVDGHAVIHRVDEAWPVYINGKPVERHVLVDGDDIELGHYLMRCIDGAHAVDAVDAADAADGVEAVEAEKTVDPIGAADAAAGDALDGSAGQAPTTVAVPDDTATSGTGPATAATPFVPAAEDSDAPPAGPGPGDDEAHGDDDAPLAFAPAGPTVSPDDAPSARDLAPDPAGPPAPDDEPSGGEAPRAPPGESGSAATREYHLDILTGINQGRRVALTQDLVVLGFNRQRLVEIRNSGGALSLRRVDDQAVAELNGAPITDEPAAAKPGDVISVQRIDLRIHAG